MSKRFTIFAATLLAVVSLLPSTGRVQAQNRHVYLEEFTGSWCGYCPRGAWAIEKLDEKYGEQVAVVSIHSDFISQGGHRDPMETDQGDSMVDKKGWPVQEGESFPGGWTARMPLGSNSQIPWNVDPSQWIHPLDGFVSSTVPGIVDTMIGKKAVAVVNLENLSFNADTSQVTVTISATFASAMTGDFRLNIMLTEDSVIGDVGSNYDQTNYFYHSGNSDNPYYNMATSGNAGDGFIGGWPHRHVFREAVAGIQGAAGIIPSPTVAGTKYSATFTFAMPDNVINRNKIHLVGIVHQFSATSISKNTVYDAMEVPLVGSLPKHFVTNIALDANNQYGIAQNSGQTPMTVNITNNGTEAVTLALVTDTSVKLPTGWSAKLSSSTLTLNPNESQPVTVTVTAPEHSAFVNVRLIATPVKEGYIVSDYKQNLFLLSDNTRYALYNAGSYENAAYIGIPDSVKQHTAILPLTTDILGNYDYTGYDAVFLNSIPILDFTADLGLGVAPSVQMINQMLAAGKKVFLNSDDALGYAFDGSDGYFAQYTTYTATPDVQDFFNRLGINFTKTVRRWNTTSGALTPFSIKGVSGDPIGNGQTVTDAGGFLSEIFSIDSASTPVFYADNNTKNVIGSRYTDPTSGGRLVYLGFGLSEISNQKLADTIAARSMAWLFSTSSNAGVNDVADNSTAFTASPNPFVGSTQVAYTAAAGERDVTFSVVDLLGREVEKLAPSANGNSYSVAFDGSDLAAGTYVIVAHTSTGSHQIRVVNEH